MAAKKKPLSASERESAANEELLKIQERYRVVFHPTSIQMEQTNSGTVILHPPSLAVTALPDDEADETTE